jgi:hypothetical protein
MIAECYENLKKGLIVALYSQYSPFFFTTPYTGKRVQYRGLVSAEKWEYREYSKTVRPSTGNTVNSPGDST